MSEDDEAKLKIRLFGAFEACLAGKPLPPLRSQKGRWLLALLALRQGQEAPRLYLAQTLWPDRLQSDALTGLRQTLADLRKALGDAADEILKVTPRALCLAVEGVDVDTRTFDRAGVRGSSESLQQAVALYRGPLLEECAEPWIVAERESREQRYLKAIEQLAAFARAAGSDAEEIDYLRRGITVDPTNEPLHGALLRALARRGDYGSAMQTYQELRQRLHEEFRAAPSPELQALYQQLRAEAERRAKAQRPRPLASTTSPPIRVPRPLTPLIGRETEVHTLMAQLAMARLVTLVGTGGAGKTRLAIHVATELAAEYADGVWFVDLSALTAPDLVAQQVALALCASEERGRTRKETLIGFLQTRQLLLVLDNCEHLLVPCAELAAALLSSCPDLRILATSRQKLGLMGESVCHVAGLALPEPAPALDPQALLSSEAVRLFVERAHAVREDFTSAGQNAGAIVSLCRLLDGLPLAIELAATLIEVMTPEEIVTRLESGLDLPPADDPTRPRRHQTLEALMASSYALLTPSEQTLLRRLAIFAGNWTLKDAEVICGDSGFWIPDSGSESSEIQNRQSKIQNGAGLFTDLSRLVAKSLVVSEAREGRSRYRMLDTIHRYAERLLEQRGEREKLRIRHRDYYLYLAEEVESHLTGPEQTRWLARLDEARDDLRSALRCAETTDGTIMLRLVNALGRFWQIRGYWSEGRNWIDRALALPPEEDGPTWRANALNWASILATYQGDLSRGQDYAEQGLAIWEALADTRGMASSLGCLGIVVCNRGDYEASREFHARSLELARANRNEIGMAGALGYLGNVAMGQGDFEAARSHYAESLALRRALNDMWGVAASLNNLGQLARHDRDWTAAHQFLEESLALRRQLGDRRCVAITLNLLGLCSCEQGDVDRARQYLTAGLEQCREIGDRRSIAYALEAFASLAMLEQQPERSVLLLSAASALREAIASPLPPSEQPTHEASKQALRDELGADTYFRQWNAGRALSLEKAFLHAYAEK